MVKKVPLALAFFTLIACAAQLWARSVHAEVFYDSMAIGGRDRSFILNIPDGAPRGLPMPTIVTLHGALMDGKFIRSIFGLEELAARDHFAVVYPNANNRIWKDGANLLRNGRDDVRFLQNLAEHLVRKGIADPKRLFLVGVSNGGMMAYRMACEAPGVYTAYSAVIASMPKQILHTCHPASGTPMIVINSTRDPINPYGDGDFGTWSREVLTTLDTVDFWQRRNGCGGISEDKPLPDKDSHDGSTVTARQYSKCRSGSPVVLLTVDGAGHLPPGAQINNRPMLRAMLGRANQDVSAADITWKFFKRFPLAAHY